MSATNVDVDLIVINYKTYDLLSAFVDSYHRFRPKRSSRLTIVDVDAADTTAIDALEADQRIAVDFNCGYAHAANLAASRSNGVVLAFFNADTRFVNDSCVDLCCEFLERNEKVAIVGPLQYSSDGQATFAGTFGSMKKRFHRGWRSPELDSFRDTRKALTVSGSAYFIKRAVWDRLTRCEIYQRLHPGVPGAFLPTPHYFEETACSYHAWAHGYEVWYVGAAEMIHEWHRASPVGGWADQQFPASKEIFVRFCKAHGIPHDE